MAVRVAWRGTSIGQHARSRWPYRVQRSDAPQWLHLRDRAKRMLNSLLHFLHEGSFAVYSGGGPLSSGIPRPSDMVAVVAVVLAGGFREAWGYMCVLQRQAGGRSQQESVDGRFQQVRPGARRRSEIHGVKPSLR